MTMDDIWLAEYSVKQECFHVETLKEAIDNNRRGLKAENPPDYIPVAAFDTEAEAVRYCRHG